MRLTWEIRGENHATRGFFIIPTFGRSQIFAPSPTQGMPSASESCVWWPWTMLANSSWTSSEPAGPTARQGGKDLPKKQRSEGFWSKRCWTKIQFKMDFEKVWLCSSGCYVPLFSGSLQTHQDQQQLSVAPWKILLSHHTTSTGAIKVPSNTGSHHTWRRHFLAMRLWCWNHSVNKTTRKP